MFYMVWSFYSNKPEAFKRKPRAVLKLQDKLTSEWAVNNSGLNTWYTCLSPKIKYQAEGYWIHGGREGKSDCSQALSGEKPDLSIINVWEVVVVEVGGGGGREGFSLGNLMPHVEEEGSEDMEVERHNVPQWQNQNHHIYQMTWRQKGNVYVSCVQRKHEWRLKNRKYTLERHTRRIHIKLYHLICCTLYSPVV